MTPEKLFHQLLGLGQSWEVVDSSFDRVESIVVLEIRETEALWERERCPQDGGSVYCYDHVPQMSWRHLNVFEHRCEIHARLPRGKCRQCGHLYRVQPPWEGLCGHFTREFEAFALLLMKEMPMTKVGQITGEHDTRLWRVLLAHLEKAYPEADFSQTCCVGVDELNRRKGREYLTVFSDLLAKRVLFATEGRDSEVWKKFVTALQEHHGRPEAILQASMDMSSAYRAGAAECCPQAQVVFDKFHVIARANEAVDMVRQTEVRRGKKGASQRLKNTLWLWRKNPENLSAAQQEKLQQLQAEEDLCTPKAYRMRLELQDIYREEQPRRAKRRLEAWCRWVKWVAAKEPLGLLQPMVRVAQTILDHLAGILGHWKWRITNAFMEGLNSVFQAVKRRARGYRTTTYLVSMLYLIAGKLRLPQSSFH